jgi:hypothetical protein
LSPLSPPRRERPDSEERRRRGEEKGGSKTIEGEGMGGVEEGKMSERVREEET